MGANFDAHTQPALLNGPYCSFKGPFSQLSTQKNSTRNYFWVNIFSLPSLSPPFCFSHSLFLFLICFQIQGCEKAAKDNVLKDRVMWLQVASQSLIQITFSASLFSIFQIALLPTQHSWPPTNLKPSLQPQPRVFTVQSAVGGIKLWPLY